MGMHDRLHLHADTSLLPDLHGWAPADVAAAVWRRAGHSESRSIGLRRDLAVPFAAPAARISLQVRPMEDRDVDAVLSPRLPGISDAERRDRRGGMRMLRAGLTTGWVAVDESDRPRYVQWLIGPEHNDLLQRLYHGLFPVLPQDEALLEGAFTPESSRGLRIMPSAMARIAERAAYFGAKYVQTWVGVHNTASLLGCERAGFRPEWTRCSRWRALRHTVTFGSLPGHDNR